MRRQRISLLQSCPWRNTCHLLLALMMLCRVESFVPFLQSVPLPRPSNEALSCPSGTKNFLGPTNTIMWTRHTTHLTAENKRGSNMKKSNNKKSKKQTKSSSPTKDNSTTSPPRSLVSNAKKQSSSSSPPWKVLSPAQAKLNVEREKKRRELVKQGIKDVSMMEETKQVLSTSFLSDTDQKLINWKRFQPMSVHAMTFVGSYLMQQPVPHLGVPEVAFLGRSNVGKSSLLNRLSSSSHQGGDQARVGKTPGATASVNLYALCDNKGRNLLGWVDLPGFGYAKLSKDVKDQVQQAAEQYLGRRKELMLGILLLDIRRTPSESDRAVLAALYDIGVPIVVVATKVDKVSDNERIMSLATIRNALGLPNGQPLAVSSVTGEGCKKLWTIVLEACEAGVLEARAKFDDTLHQSVHETNNDAEVQDEEDIFDDGDDLVYSQGYDWIHDEGRVMYEEDTESTVEDDIWVDEHDEEWDEEPEDKIDPPERETLRSLRKKARDMERRGEL